MKARFFWLLSDGKTVREVDGVKRWKLLTSRHHHLISIYPDGDFYTTRQWVYGVQWREVQRLLGASE